MSCIYVCVCVYIHIYIHVYIYAFSIYIYIHTYIYTYIHTYIHVFLYFADRASQYIYLNINQLDALNFIMSLFHASKCFEHYVLIIRRSNSYYTASGIITPIGGRPVHSPLSTCARDGHLQVWWYQRLYSTILAFWRWARVLETCRGMK